MCDFDFVWVAPPPRRRVSGSRVPAEKAVHSWITGKEISYPRRVAYIQALPPACCCTCTAMGYGHLSTHQSPGSTCAVHPRTRLSRLCGSATCQGDKMRSSIKTQAPPPSCLLPFLLLVCSTTTTAFWCLPLSEPG
jgi:hypothetical protein